MLSYKVSFSIQFIKTTRVCLFTVKIFLFWLKYLPRNYITHLEYMLHFQIYPRHVDIASIRTALRSQESEAHPLD